MDRQPTTRAARYGMTEAGARELALSLQRYWNQRGHSDVVFRVMRCPVKDPASHDTVWQVRSSLTGREAV